jgi:excisionase family DNA binding protein
MNAEPLWTWKEVASYLRVGRSTVFKLAAGELPCVHVRRQLRFNPEAVRRWVEEQGRPARLKGAV